MYLLLPLQGFLQHFLECIHGILVIGHSYVGEDSFDSCKNGYSLLYPFVFTFFICVDPKDGSIVLCQESKPSEAFPCLLSLDCLPGGTVFHGPCDTDHLLSVLNGILDYVLLQIVHQTKKVYHYKNYGTYQKISQGTYQGITCQEFAYHLFPSSVFL